MNGFHSQPFNQQNAQDVASLGQFRRARVRLVVLAFLAMAVFTGHAWAGVGCDLNVRVNNHTANSLMVYGASKSSASKSGLNLWSPLTGMVDSTLDSENSGAASHSKQAVELQLPCWTGKVDFKIHYLAGNTPKWTRRDGVDI